VWVRLRATGRAKTAQIDRRAAVREWSMEGWCPSDCGRRRNATGAPYAGIPSASFADRLLWRSSSKSATWLTPSETLYCKKASVNAILCEVGLRKSEPS
jgi:hypothetical protein